MLWIQIRIRIYDSDQDLTIFLFVFYEYLRVLILIFQLLKVTFFQDLKSRCEFIIVLDITISVCGSLWSYLFFVLIVACLLPIFIL